MRARPVPPSAPSAPCAQVLLRKVRRWAFRHGGAFPPAGGAGGFLRYDEAVRLARCNPKGSGPTDRIRWAGVKALDRAMEKLARCYCGVTQHAQTPPPHPHTHTHLMLSSTQRPPVDAACFMPHAPPNHRNVRLRCGPAVLRVPRAHAISRVREWAHGCSGFGLAGRL